MSGDEAAAALDELPELIALLIGERGDVRQDQRFELREMRCVEQPVMHHLKRNARFDQRLIPAQRVVLDVAFARSRRTTPSVANKPGHARERALHCADIFPSARNAADRSPRPASASARRAARRRTS